MIYKKEFGQHFLKNETICQDIVNLLFLHDSVDDVSSVKLIEIGPGAGAITKYLSTYKWADFKAVEIDKHKIAYLIDKKILSEEQIIAEDFLTISAPHEGQFKIIGNFPYNISTQIMFKLFSWYPQVTEMVGMFQKEVAVRICSQEGGKEYGILSVLTQALYHCQVDIHVGPMEFTPPPKVDSAVISLKANNNIYEIQNFGKFTSFVKRSFSMRRKTLRNNLKGMLKPEVLADEFFNKRPEQVSVVEFINLYKSNLNDE